MTGQYARSLISNSGREILPVLSCDCSSDGWLTHRSSCDAVLVYLRGWSDWIYQFSSICAVRDVNSLWAGSRATSGNEKVTSTNRNLTCSTRCYTSISPSYHRFKSSSQLISRQSHTYHNRVLASFQHLGVERQLPQLTCSVPSRARPIVDRTLPYYHTTRTEE
jgi:hypothetical protein